MKKDHTKHGEDKEMEGQTYAGYTYRSVSGFSTKNVLYTQT